MNFTLTHRILLGISLAFPCSQLSAAEPLAETTMFDVAAPSGWAITKDGGTLIVAQPKTAELLYFDTVAEKLQQQIELEFAPGTMLLHGTSLYVTVDGSGVIYKLNRRTGKQEKRYSVRGNAISDLAIDPSNRQRLFAATKTYEVFSVDLRTGRATKTNATGNLVETNPKIKNRVFTGVKRNDTRDVFLIKTNSRGDLRIIWDRWGPRSGILAYEVNRNSLKLFSAQTNATVNAYTMTMSPDGKRIMMTGGGGWRPPADVSGAGGYYTAVFDSNDLETMLGKAPHGTELLFHPVLKIGVCNKNGRDLQFFDSRSYAEQEKIHLADGADMRPLLMTFAAKGTKIAVWNGDNPKNPREGLHFVTLNLSSKDRALLTKEYGSLPKARPAAKKAMAKKTTSPTPNPNPTPKPTPSSQPQNRSSSDLKKGDLSIAGFNNRKGLGIKKSGRKRLYQLNRANVRGGTGEPGWSGPWPASEHAMFQNRKVYEGDGALHLAGTVNFARRFAKPLTGTVEIEQYVLTPEGGQLSCYIWEESHNSCGPMWRIYRGKFEALDSDNRGRKTWSDTGITADTDEWTKVVVRIDTEKRRWKLALPDKKYISEELQYRSNPRELREINYLTETPAGIFVDALQIRGVE